MWVRKTDEQMASEARESSRVWRSLQGPAILFAACFAAVCVTAVVGDRAPSPTVYWPGTWSDLYEILTRAVFGGIVVGTLAAIVGYVWQLVLRKRILRNNVKVVICDTCHRVKRRDGENKCECGGTFENFENWTWVDD